MQASWPLNVERAVKIAWTMQAWGLGVVAGLACAAAALAQGTPGDAPGSQNYDHPAEIRALDALVPEVLGDMASAEVSPADLIELSRLLSSPCDQVRWLRGQAQARAGQSAAQRAAWLLARATIERGQRLADGQFLDACGDVLPAVSELVRSLEPLDGITDPEVLRGRLADAGDLRGLPVYARFVLLARGAPAQRVFARGALEAWDTPRLAVARVANQVELPPVWELLDWQERLAAAHEEWRQAAAELSGAGEREAIEASFAVAAGLLDRALNLDGQAPAGWLTAVPHDDDAAAWTQQAERLERADAWLWTALARMLAAATPDGQKPNGEAVAAAQAAWGRYRAVGTAAWQAVDDAADGWLTRLAAGERLAEAGRLPMALGVSDALWRARGAHEATIRTLMAQGTPDAEAVLRAIQMAKAAQCGVDAEPLGIEALERELGEMQLVYLFVELIELMPAAGGGEPQYCGVAVYRKLYQERIATVAYTDEYLSKVIPWQASAEDVVAAALAAPGPPLRENGEIQEDARIIVALDGVPGAEWFAFEWDALLQTTSWGLKPSWIVYTPSAAAMVSEAWGIDATLRGWYQGALRRGEARPMLATAPVQVGTRGGGAPLERQNMTVYGVAVGDAAVGGVRTLANLMTMKREAAVEILPVWVSR